MHYPQHLLKVIEILKRLPGVGTKSAERFAFQLLNWKSDHIKEMSEVIGQIPDKLKHCAQCGCLSDDAGCPFCKDERAQAGILCVIATPRDAFAIEHTREYKGLYHVLGGLLSPMEGIGPEKLALNQLKQRVHSNSIKEIVLALDSTLEGDTTALYIKQELAVFSSIPVSRLAFGLPMGSSLDYVDGGTLARALSARAKF